MRKKSNVVLAVIFCISLIAIFVVTLLSSPPKKDEREELRKKLHTFDVATLEYVNEDGFRLITSEVSQFYTLPSLNVRPSKETFDEEKWIYRISFNPKQLIDNDETEFVILFGEHNISINGKTYEAEDVDYSEILNWINGKYNYFRDYKLFHDYEEMLEFYKESYNPQY